eukprot:scaffold24742_cov57-Phaeocystis_antarctica.AAC.1
MVDLNADVVRPRGLARVGASLLGELTVGEEIVAIELKAADGKINLAVAVLCALEKQMRVLDERLRHAEFGRSKLRRVHEGEGDRVSRSLRGGQPVGELASGCVAEADGGTTLLKVTIQRVALPAAGLLVKSIRDVEPRPRNRRGDRPREGGGEVDGLLRLGRLHDAARLRSVRVLILSPIGA